MNACTIRDYLVHYVKTVCALCGDFLCGYHHLSRYVMIKVNGWFWRSKMCILWDLGHKTELFSSSTTDLVAYLDADWAGCPTTRRSTFGYCVFLGKNLLSWSSKCQPMLSYSSDEAEYHDVANGVTETCWLRNLLRELHTPLSSATLVYCDNVSAVYLSSNLVRVLHVPSHYQYADIFTKGLPSALFEEFHTSLSVQCPPAPTAGEC
ncbi:ribonuclease H-like domain-containing protein [Tanacetum coccineum]